MSSLLRAVLQAFVTICVVWWLAGEISNAADRSCCAGIEHLSAFPLKNVIPMLRAVCSSCSSLSERGTMKKRPRLSNHLPLSSAFSFHTVNDNITPMAVSGGWWAVVTYSRWNLAEGGTSSFVAICVVWWLVGQISCVENCS